MQPPLMSTSRTSTSVSSTIAAAIASIPAGINLAQLLQMAQSLKNPQQSSSSQQSRSNSNQSSRSTTTITPVPISSVTTLSHHQNNGTRDVNEVVDMDVESPSPPQLSSS